MTALACHERHAIRRVRHELRRRLLTVQAVEFSLPDGDGFAWVAGESLTAKAVRRHLVAERGLPKAWVKAAGYWRSGSLGIHERHDE